MENKTKLTQEQMELVRLIKQGKNSAEISRTMGTNYQLVMQQPPPTTKSKK
jgi:DNA-binding CsgD family transcriptional regulator